MSDKLLIDKLKELHAWATGTADLATRLISTLEGEQTSSSARKGLSEEEKVKVKAKLRSRFFK